MLPRGTLLLTSHTQHIQYALYYCFFIKYNFFEFLTPSFPYLLCLHALTFMPWCNTKINLSPHRIVLNNLKTVLKKIVKKYIFEAIFMINYSFSYYIIIFLNFPKYSRKLRRSHFQLGHTISSRPTPPPTTHS